MNGIIIFSVILLILILIKYKPQSTNIKNIEGFVYDPIHKKTWKDWDNYDKNYHDSKLYWGTPAEGGGWDRKDPKSVYRKITAGMNEEDKYKAQIML